MATSMIPSGSSGSIPQITYDAAGRIRTSNIRTLFDGKALNADEDEIWENVGTGTGLFVDNTYQMSVASGQYQIRRGNRVCPYFSGKSQVIETTFDKFAAQANVTKIVGYFSSNETTPYNSNFDGFWLENDTVNGIRIRIFKAGVEQITVPLADWDNFPLFENYDWDNFTVAFWDFLWLGGTHVDLYIMTDKGFILAHSYKHAGNTQGVVIKSPNHSVRYEIRSTTGVGSMTSICSQVATEGSFGEAGKKLSLANPLTIPTNSTSTIYALKGVKKLSSFRDISVYIKEAHVANATTNDIGMAYLLLNPTLSAPLTYVTNGRIEEGTATNQTVIDVGWIAANFPSSEGGTAADADDNFLASIPMDIANISGEIVLAYAPTTSNQSVRGSLGLKIY